MCTSCVKGKAQAEPHKPIERITEDSEHPIVQCDHFVLEDIAVSDGLKVLGMCVQSFGYGTSTVVETKGATDTVVRSSPRRSHQSNEAVGNYQKQLQVQVCTMLAAFHDRTQYRPTTYSECIDEMDCSTCSLAHSSF